jgi:hypothetical protein
MIAPHRGNRSKPVIRWMAATLDGIVEGNGALFEAKFMLPWSFSEEAAAEKHMAQLQHNMWVTNATAAVLSIITGGGKWVEIKISADSLYQRERPTSSTGVDDVGEGGDRLSLQPSLLSTLRSPCAFADPDDGVELGPWCSSSVPLT